MSQKKYFDFLDVQLSLFIVKYVETVLQAPCCCPHSFPVSQSVAGRKSVVG